MEKFNYKKHTGFSLPIFSFEDIISEEELKEVEREVDLKLINQKEVIKNG